MYRNYTNHDVGNNDVLRKRGVFKTTNSRRGEYSFSEQQIAEIEYRLEALKPYMSV